MSLGQGVARAVPVVCVAIVVLRVAAVATGVVIEARPPKESHRDLVIRELQKQPGKQLVIVHYGPQQVPHDEWVYNAADIDASPIVWARDMGDRKNHELIAYFKGRDVWQLDAEDAASKPVAYGMR